MASPTNQKVLILGSGHLADRTKKFLSAKGFTVHHITDLISALPNGESSTIKEMEKVLQGMNLELFTMTYVLYEKEEHNLEMVISLMALRPHIKIATALFNESIQPHLEAANPNLRIINPAKIAAPFFTEALNYEINRKQINPVKDQPKAQLKSNRDVFVLLLILAFASIAFGTAAYFHFGEGLSWLDAFYFVVVTISTVGYGDINLQHASSISKVVGITLILSSVIFVWLIFSLLIDNVLKRRNQLALGQKRYTYRNHIVLCGLGRLGYFVAEELVRAGEKIVIIEAKEDKANIDYFRNQNVDIYIGNARLPYVLQNAGVEKCKALISVINDDFANLEIALNARSFQSGLRLILRIFDESMAEAIKEKFDVHLTKSMSFIAAEKFASLLD